MWYLDWHLNHGCVFSTTEFFVMARPIVRQPSAPETQSVIDGFNTWPDGVADCWYVHAYAGDLSKVWAIVPYPLKWVAFERIQCDRRVLRFHRFEDLHRLTNHALETSLLA